MKITATKIGFVLAAALLTTGCESKKEEPGKTPEAAAGAKDKPADAKPADAKPADAKPADKPGAAAAPDKPEDDAVAAKETDKEGDKKGGKEGSCGEGGCGGKDKKDAKKDGKAGSCGAGSCG